MRTATEGARRGTPRAELLSKGHKPAALVKEIVHWLDEAKGEEVVTIDLKGKSSIGDFMVIVSGRTDRHVGAVAAQAEGQGARPRTH
jgi:ribosome-associated protein